MESSSVADFGGTVRPFLNSRHTPPGYTIMQNRNDVQFAVTLPPFDHNTMIKDWNSSELLVCDQRSVSINA